MDKFESKYTLGFPISEELHGKLRTLIDKIQNSQDKKPHVQQLISCIDELIDIGMDYYFFYPTDLAKVNFLTRNAVGLSLKAAKKGVFPVVSKIIKSFDDSQLLVVAKYIEDTLNRCNK